MSSTLAERLRQALDARAATDPSATQAALAKHCKVKPPSVSDWFTGETKVLRAGSLIRAAEFLGVRPLWLLEGSGPMTAADGPAPAQPALCAAVHLVVSRMAHLDDYRANQAATALRACARPGAPLRAIERDLIGWLNAPPHTESGA